MVTVKYDFSLKEHNTFGIDAKCKCFITFDTIDDITEVLPIIKQHRNNMIILGGGSNLLLTGDYDGLVVHPKIMGWEAADGADGVMLRVGCGMESGGTVRWQGMAWFGESVADSWQCGRKRRSEYRCLWRRGKGCDIQG